MMIRENLSKRGRSLSLSRKLWSSVSWGEPVTLPYSDAFPLGLTWMVSRAAMEAPPK
jgi:hypothetical protein